jgi:ribosomal protein S18 acetylase RimI-like enzyme
MTRYAISETVNEAQIRTFLLTDENYAAYALGDLDPPYSGHAQWIIAASSGNVEALGLHYAHFDPSVLFLQGTDAAVSALLEHGIGPEKIYFTTRPEHEVLLRGCYDVQEVNRMYRMRVYGETFAPVAPGLNAAAIVDLKTAHADALFALLQRAAVADERPIHDIAFAPEMLADGYYYGIFDGTKLVAAAGTHLVARPSRIAAVGNVVTDPASRRRGFAKLATSAVTQTLLDEDFAMVVLNVQQSNTAAVSAYKRLGYQITCEFIEGLAVRH